MNRYTLPAAVFFLLSCSEGDTVNNYYITPESSAGTASSSSIASSSGNASSSSSAQAVSSSGTAQSSSSGVSSSSAMSSSSVNVSSSSIITQSSSAKQTGIISGEPITYMGETYETVVIGTQTWMARNLNVATGGICWDKKQTNCDIYGKLYNWFTANEICPDGWHLPTKEEWQTLTTFAGGKNSAAKKLKAKSGWKDNGNGTDDYGFAALPGGDGIQNDTYYYIGEEGYWWSATEFSNDCAEALYMYYNYDYANFKPNKDKGSLNSVRCVKD